MNFNRHRPQDYIGPGDSLLSPLIDELTSRLFEAQLHLNYSTLMLPEAAWAKLAHVLIEFGEDLHCDLGLWRSLEAYNQEFFGTPLPFITPINRPAGFKPSTADRVCYLLWVLYPELEPNLTLSPSHQDLRSLANVAAAFLTSRLAHLPKHSGIKSFLAGSNRHGWDVKRKLIWLRQHSYLFRLCFARYVEDHGGRMDIPTVDNFVCQEPTSWSGLGVIDLLAAILPLKESQRATLHGWYERHLAYYRLVEARRARLKAINLMTDEVYDIQMDDGAELFRAGQVIFGSLIPWEGRWYWSGQQTDASRLSEADLRVACQMLSEQNPGIVYRYDKGRLQAAQAFLDRLSRHFLDDHGDDFVIYPSGQAMIAAERRRYRRYNEMRLAEDPTPAAQAEFASLGGGPTLPYPKEVTDHEDGIGLFFNPKEGLEFMIRFNTVLSGLRKRGVSLTEDEVDVLQGLIKSTALSPAFVHRVTQGDGAQSIAAAFLIGDDQNQPYLDYLLRRHKGYFYRRRYPNVSVV